MGTDAYADAAGLVARSAAAYVASVPTDPADDGFFGPASVTWRMSADLASPVAGLRALLMQALHPLAMAGVDQHSDWRRDPVGRLAATSAYLATVSFGDRAAAERAAARVRRIHDHVRGTDPVTGRPYAAGDPALLLWVHAALVESAWPPASCSGRRWRPPTATVTSRRWWSRPNWSASRPRWSRPDVAGLRQYLSSVRPELRCTPAAADAVAFLLEPPGLDPDIAEIWQDIRDGATAAMPDWALQMYGYHAPGALTPARRAEIRQALGVLDVVFLGRARRAGGAAADRPPDARRAARMRKALAAAVGRRRARGRWA